MTQLTPPTWHRAIFGTRIMTMALGAFILIIVQSSPTRAQWGTSGTNIYNTNSGNVGVGTTTPTRKLEVQGAAALNGTSKEILVLTDTTTAAAGVGGGIVFAGKFNSGGTIAGQFASINGIKENGTDGNYASAMTFYTRVNGGNPTERMRIDSTGNVGIGTTTPAARLDVQGTGYFSSVVSLGHATSFARLGQNLSVTNAANYGGMTLSTFSAVNADQAPVMDFNRSKSSTIGTYTAVANNDVLGHIIFRGSTGSAFGDFARIAGAVDGATIAAGDTPGRLVFWTTPDGSGTLLERMRIDSGGNVGIGTASPNTNLVGTYSYPASVKVAQIDSTQARLVVRGSTDSGIDLIGTSAAVKWMQLYNSAGVTKFRSVDDSANLKADNVVAMDNSTGNVGIGTAPTSYRLDVNGNTNVTGNINVTGSINAKYQDVAEWVPASHALSVGTVVTLDPTKSNHVEASTHAYDTRVAGVVSAQPGITLGEKGAGKVLVATTGRVKVMVDASNGPIQVGDLLVTSDIAGVAKKSEPLMLGGVPIHRPGTLIGKALEPLANGRGETLVLLSLQ